MFTENSIKALLLIAEGFKTLAESIEVGGELLPVVEETTEKAVEAEASEEEAEAEEEADAEESSESEEEDLESLSYNELKKRAKEAGVSATGNRKELIEKIRNADGEESEPEAEEPQEEKKPVASKKPVKKVEEPEDEEEPTTQELVDKAVADMSDDELREVLEDVELSTKGKRTALISRIVTAVDEGVITLDADDGDESEDEPDSDSEDGDITSDMTPERKEAYEELCDGTETDFNEGEISREDLINFLGEFNGLTTKKATAQYKSVSDAELLEEYLRAMSFFVDDDGTVVEEGAYIINDEPYCCGHPLEYDDKTGKFHCSICDGEYEAE